MNLNLNIPNVAIHDAERLTGLEGAAAIKKVIRAGLEYLTMQNEGHTLSKQEIAMVHVTPIEAIRGEVKGMEKTFHGWSN